MESKPQVVLSVDDNDVDGALLERAFKRTSIPARLYRVSEGPQAMAYLAGDGIYRDRDNYPLPDLVLLDLAMPKMSGVEVLKWIRQQPVVKRTKVLIFTSSEKPDDFRAANEIGADGYLLKPTKFDDLKKLVKQIHDEWLAKRKAARGAAGATMRRDQDDEALASEGEASNLGSAADEARSPDALATSSTFARN
jgi:CheY-like chemotaxis protein